MNAVLPIGTWNIQHTTNKPNYSKKIEHLPSLTLLLIMFTTRWTKSNSPEVRILSVISSALHPSSTLLWVTPLSQYTLCNSDQQKSQWKETLKKDGCHSCTMIHVTGVFFSLKGVGEWCFYRWRFLIVCQLPSEELWEFTLNGWSDGLHDVQRSYSMMSLFG